MLCRPAFVGLFCCLLVFYLFYVIPELGYCNLYQIDIWGTIILIGNKKKKILYQKKFLSDRNFLLMFNLCKKMLNIFNIFAEKQ